MALKDYLVRKEIVVLELLTKRTLTPRDISGWALLSLEETSAVISSLLRKGYVMQMSDGFSAFFYITPAGNAFLKENKETPQQ